MFGLLRIDAKIKTKPLALGLDLPGAENHLILLHGTAREYRDVCKRAQGEGPIERTQSATQGAIHDDPHCTFACVGGQKDYRSSKAGITKSGMCEQQGTGEFLF